jgi:hypothetical protein
MSKLIIENQVHQSDERRFTAPMDVISAAAADGLKAHLEEAGAAV